MIESLLLEIIHDTEADEPYFSILCTDQDGNVIELLTDNVFNTYGEAILELERIVKIIKGGK